MKEIPFLIYRTPQDDVRVDVAVKDETIWLTQKAMAALFGVEVPAISKHLANIYTEGELAPNSTVSKMEIVQQEGTRNIKRKVDFYNLDMIISVGYRVHSARATQFRIWATKTLKEFLIKGFVLDDERLKQGKIIFGNCWIESVPSEPVNGVFGSRLPIFLPSAVGIMTDIPLSHGNFTRWCRISFTMLSRVRRLRRLFLPRPTGRRKTWGYRRGRMLLMDGFSNRT